MKVILFSVLFLFLSILIAPAKIIGTQNQNITLNVTNITIRNTIDRIEKTEGYVFLYNDDVRSELDRKVSLQVTNKHIDEVLDKLLSHTDISYKRAGKQITLYRRHAKVQRQASSAEDSQTPLQQTSDKHTVKGKVVDDKNEPVIGATVKINGQSTSGTITDIDGNYVLPNVAPNDVITFSYVGMRPQQVVVGNKNVLNVTMRSEVRDLSDVVVVGYGTQKKESLTGSISMVTSKDLVTTPQVSASNMLTGRVPGLITTQTYGIPGSDNATLSIRGFGNALFIVDGVERDARYIDPNTIESISVLKDASSAIYGSRAGNGVVLITTKRGRLSKPVVTVGATLTFQSVTDMPKMVSSGQLAELKREEFYNKHGADTPLTPPYTEEQVKKYYEGTDPQYPNTDWYDLMIRNWAPMQQYNASVRGGSDRFSYYSYFGYTKQESILKTDFGNYQRYAFQTNLDAKITDRLKLQVSMSYNLNDRNYPSRNAFDGEASIWGAFWVTLPIYPAYFPNRNYLSYGGGATGGIALIADRGISGYNRSKAYTTELSGTLTYDFKYVPGLSFKAFVDYTKSDNPTKIFYKSIDFYTYNYANDEYTYKGSYNKGGGLEQSQVYSTMLTTQLSLNYERLFAKLHRVKAMALFEAVDTKSDNLSASRKDFFTMAIDQMFMGSTATAANDGSATENGRASFVGRMNYAYADKYLLEFILRADASAHFAPGHRWGYFPGVMLGWRIEQEKFMSKLKFDMLKLRLSYGQMGNDAIGNFQYLSGYKLYEMTYLLGTTSVNGIKSTGIANPDMTWERMHISNVGLDFSWNNRRVYGAFEIFYRKRSGILARRNGSLPSTFGATPPLENLNSQSTRGWEIELGTAGHINSLNYDVKANLSWSRSKWIHYEEANYTDPDQIRLFKNSGEWVDRQIGYISKGLFTSQEQIDNLGYTYPGGNEKLRPGDIIIADRNDDKVIDWRDQEIIGKGTIPHYMLGVNINLQYKGFDLSMLFQGAFGFYKKLRFWSSNTNDNFYSFIYDKRWSEQNNDPNALIPRLGGSATNDYITQNNFVKSDYMRLKTMSFGYNIPKSFLAKLKIESARINVSAYNLLTISGLHKYNFDPEAPSGETGRSYPLNKTISFGLDVSF